MRRTTFFAILAVSFALGTPHGIHAIRSRSHASLAAAPVIDWSHEARRAIVPPGPGGIFGPENYGNKFPGEAAVYMGIVHAAIYDAAITVAGGYHPYATALTSPVAASPEAAVATAAHRVLVAGRGARPLGPIQLRLAVSTDNTPGGAWGARVGVTDPSPQRSPGSG